MADMFARANTNTIAPVGNGGMRMLESTRDGALFTADWITKLVLAGRVFIATDGDANDRVTGQTSFADTTPTFLLRVPSGVVCIPLLMYLGQAGTVAGAAIDVSVALATSDAWASGGTSETVYNARLKSANANSCTLYSGATATTALLTRQVRSWALGQDVSPAEGAVQEVIWTPDKMGGVPLVLEGAASLGVFTSAGTTGPTWYWTFAWAELDTANVTG